MFTTKFASCSVICLCAVLLAPAGPSAAAGEGQSPQAVVPVQVEEPSSIRMPEADPGGVVQESALDSQARVADLDAAVAVLDELVSRPPPAALSRADLSAWNEHTKWLASVRDRYESLRGQYASFAVGGAVAGGALPGGSVLSSAISSSGKRAPGSESVSTDGSAAPAGAEQLDAEFRKLQAAAQQESRRFQTLSNVSKVRHDTAMSSIRNMK